MAILVPSGIIFGWPSTAGSIPTGYTRETALDGYHVKGAAAGADPGTTGGSATHTHTSPTHTHTISSHSHDVSAVILTYTGTVEDSSWTAPTVETPSSPGHVHSGGTTSGSTTGSLGAQAATWATGSSEPSYAGVIWIKSDGTHAGVPASGWCWWDAAGGAPSSWTLHASGKTRYLKGASAGGNGGSTGGGGSHSHAASAHTHSVSSHSHTGGTINAASGYTNTQTGSTGVAADAHTHTYAVSITSSSTSSSTSSASTGSTTLDPVFTTLAVIANGTGGYSFPEGIIGIWLGLRTNIPSGWILCDGSGGTLDTRGKFVKGANVLGDIGTTGGSATHTHTDPTTHTHTTAHTHPIVIWPVNGAETITTGGAGIDSSLLGAHSHPAATSDASSASTSGTGTQTVNLGSSEPLYKTVLFVKFTGAITVTITSPIDGSVVAAPGVSVAWTLSDSTTGVQTSYRLRVYETNDATSTPIYDTGTVVTSTTTASLPTNIGLRTGHTYYVRVSAIDTAGDPGDSSLTSFVTSWTPPATVTGLRLTPVGGS